MPTTMAMPVVLSPKMLPCAIRRAPAKHRETPEVNRTRCNILMFLFNFYASLLISNFMLDIFNFMLDKCDMCYLSVTAPKTATKEYAYKF